MSISAQKITFAFLMEESSLVGVITGLLLLIISSIFLWIVERRVAHFALMAKRCRVASREVPSCDIAFSDNNERPIMIHGE